MSPEESGKLVAAVDGGPGRNRNTALMLEEVSRGAREEGAGTEPVRLRDLEFKGRVGRFSRERKETRLDGRRAPKDGLSPVLALPERATGLATGSPVHPNDVTGRLEELHGTPRLHKPGP
jgi:multimeric flavodoxin WrbA